MPSRGIRGKITFSHHANRQMATKGFTREQVLAAVRNPYKVTDVRRYPGQLRYCGSGVAVVVDGNHVVTIYLDGIPTPLRADQMNDPEALSSKRPGRA